MAATVLTAALAAVSGCAAAPAPRPHATASLSPALRDSAASAVLTSDATTLRQHWQLKNAEQLLIQQCMLKRGLPYHTTGSGPEPEAGATTADTTGTASPPLYAITAPPVSTVGGMTAQDRYVHSLTSTAQAGYLAAYSGPDTRTETLALPSGAVVRYLIGGCEGQARAELYGSVRAAVSDSLVPQDVNQQFDTFLATNRPYQSALAAWRRCMAQSGWQATTPTNAIQASQSLADTSGSRTDAVAKRQSSEVAADIRCDTASDLRGTRTEQRNTFVHHLPTRTRDWLAQTEQAKLQALRRIPRTA
ncbi:hypothetical protein [Peterkaempfera sp. SMS 1(5)a]|uniref:hypothetical protein n=1 Tax=Peterkaempfera podocarpi TaxID=3232308 RepID=UPI00366F92B0